MELLRPRLRDSQTRLVTLLGPGGAGKTRLALEVTQGLESFPGGVWFVDLAPITDPALVASGIAATLGVKETDKQPLMESLTAYLAQKRLLLILDNFEQLLAASPVVDDLLRAAPGLKVLATSRALLGVYGEHAFEVPPLALPVPTELPPVDHLWKYAAVRLFVERAQAARSDFALTPANAAPVVEICRRLDGLPLAIELAAVRVRILPPHALLERLRSRLHVLTTGPRTLRVRQQTLRATIDWSYDLLDDDEQMLFRRLAVFVGGWTLEAAETVCNHDGRLGRNVLDALQSLVDKSLFRAAFSGGSSLPGVARAENDRSQDLSEQRFGMLETISEYARERLQASDEHEMLRQQHASYYLSLAEPMSMFDWESDRAHAWLNLVERAYDNFRAALVWADEQADTELLARLAVALAPFWWMRSNASEGRQWLDAALARASTMEAAAFPGALRIKLLGFSGHMQAGINREKARRLFESALSLSHDLGDQRSAAYSLLGLGGAAVDLRAAPRLFEESLDLFRTVGDPYGMARALASLGYLAHDQGDFDRAVMLIEESLVLSRELGNQGGVAHNLHNLGIVKLHQGDYASAVAQFEEALQRYRDLRLEEGAIGGLLDLGMALRYQRDLERAQALIEKCLSLAREYGLKRLIHLGLRSLGDVAQDQGDVTGAARMYRESLEMCWQMGDQWDVAACLEGLASAAVRQRPQVSAEADAVRAARLWGAAQAVRRAISAPLPPADRPAYESAVAVARGRISDIVWDAAWAGGQAMPLEQAIAYALEDARGV